jgi:hypothetical protein
MQDKKIKNKRGKKNVYIKIIYSELLFISYTLRNTIANFKCWLNVRILMRVDFVIFFEIFPKHKEGNDT